MARRANLELLSPAGNYESLKAAIYGGANAVYLGLTNFSARAKAQNFSIDELKKATEFAHLFNVKVHVAVNTLIKDSELDDAVELICVAEKAGADAFILQDLGLLSRMRELTSLPLHASTQMGIHNLYGAKLAKKLGFDRIILSRETLLEDIRQIHENVDIEIESFVHGALCVAFSGNCYLSSLASGYSGNRGKCMQLCRKKYSVEIDGTKRDGYYLSAKDICRLNDLRELADAGVMSFKIEGRMRRPEYVGESTHVYRQALDAVSSDTLFDSNEAVENLKKVYNRGNYCRGYLNSPTENVIYPIVQGNIGSPIGNVKSVRNSIAVLHTKAAIHKGDGLKFVNDSGETGGCLVGNPDAVSFEGNVKEGDRVYRTTDALFNEQINSRKKTLDLNYKVMLRVEEKPKVEIFANGISTVYVGEEIVESARSAPLEIRQIEDVFLKGANEPFAVSGVEVTADRDIFMPIGKLKSLRRASECHIREKLAESYKPAKRVNIDENNSIMSDIIHIFDIKSLICIESSEELARFKSLDCDAYILYPKDYADVKEIDCVIKESEKPVFIYTPVMARGKDIAVLQKLADDPLIENIVASNLYALEMFKGKNVLIGAEMNMINNALKLVKISPYEAEAFGSRDYVTAFSHLPLMTFAHCPRKSLYGTCLSSCESMKGIMRDEKGNKFALSGYKVNYCYAQLRNEIPFYILDELKRNKHDRIVYDFRGLTLRQATQVLSGDFGKFPHTHFNYNKTLR